VAVATRLTLDSPLTAVPGLKPSEKAPLERLRLHTVRDLLLHLPFDWEAYGGPTPIAGLVGGRQATVVGTVERVDAQQTPRKRLRLTKITLRDDAGSLLTVVWFNMPYLARKYKVGDRLAVAGTVRETRYGLGLEMLNPHLEGLSGDGPGPKRIGGLMPKYHLTRGLISPRLAALIQVVLPLAEDFEDTLPDLVRRRHRLISLSDAIRQGHQPETQEEWRTARNRLVWGELFELQAAFLVARRRYAAEKAESIHYHQEVIESFKQGLPFQLTLAQRRATWEVFQDLEKEVPMNRLVNGDVGSGKTAVAAAAAAMAHASGFQTVVMAPTEILARQHLHKFRAYLEDTFGDLRVDLLVSGLPAAERRRVLTSTASGHTAVLVGTHALLESEVQVARLGLAVVDEQQRFGTRQRETLRRKGLPHFLAMTATPIPRTLALALYGEMALSVIDEMPPGRRPVETRLISRSSREQAYELVRREVRAGRQAYVICPLVEDSQSLQVKAATAEFERLRKEVFPDLRLGLVHGRMRDKDAVMEAFRAGQNDVLVATPVIEVGVDVPNATVMLIEGADRFGLAQLHQFRGRVGRGESASYALLLADDLTVPTEQRLRLVVELHDGFRLAEEDLKLRGMGELMGSRQHGMSDLAMQALQQPLLLSEVRQEAELTVDADPDLVENPALLRAVERRLQETSIS
jgi:ATP-dependent DNA helicase RecG